MDKLLAEIRSCTVCRSFLPNVPRPIVQASRTSKIVIVGQAPGQKVQNSGIPWDDLSGNELRRWLGVSKEQFYDPELFALLPMGFCYPGKGTTGDLPPRPECAPLWHKLVFDQTTEIRLVILIGQYAHNYYLKDSRKATLTDTVKSFKDYLPHYLPLVHPSPRNKIWQIKNPWFESEVVKVIRETVQKNQV
ncbi:uracil-DNA glycosylase family protein [Mucilaginibacter paludis]|uniref:Uracil-DNA glycosylase superfamily n=1 Tax=Mucilaginibacter paludis DSM 18603 TaxID=714943 RepID=H1Y9B9_9SPHI|nr:uracil-DNA glycosylase family protein [Mucilaginibacter paludis]EHQ29497.1 Uracil-DNA glycosylase superfamily [Mucilaginibacter paludis DSM 18603]